MTTRTDLGRAIEQGLKEAAAWRRGELDLLVRSVDAMPAARVKAIRKAVATSPREFEQRFGVPARTVEGWEQGKKIDIAARVLLTIIEREPEAVERALASGKR